MLTPKSKRSQRALDAKLASFQPAASQPPPPKGWIKAAREALGMNGQQFADRLGVAWQSMSDLEKSESQGTITINSLRKAAAALGGTLVYAIVPDAGSFEKAVNDRARLIAQRQLARSHQTMLLEDQAVDDSDAEQRLQDYIDEHIRDADLWSDT